MSTSFEEYQAERTLLIESDYALRRDRALPSLSGREFSADKLLRRIRAREAESIWTADYESIPHPFPGMEFLTGKNHIVRPLF